jgi:hypothetical protein
MQRFQCLHPSVLTFLLHKMLYQDGLAGIYYIKASDIIVDSITQHVVGKSITTFITLFYGCYQKAKRSVNSFLSTRFFVPTFSFRVEMSDGFYIIYHCGYS